MAKRFAAGCGLTGDASSYFVDLVAFTQAKTTDEKAARYERLIRFRAHRDIHHIDIAYGQYHSRWYMPAIRELAFRDDFDGDPAWVAQQLLPTITVKEAREALALLLDLDLLMEQDGRLTPSDALVTTGPEVKGIHYMQYHRTMMSRAGVALDTLPAVDRDISSVTLCLDDDGMAKLKERIRAFRRELLALSSAVSDPKRVIQVNFQAFPLSKKSEP